MSHEAIAAYNTYRWHRVVSSSALTDDTVKLIIQTINREAHSRFVTGYAQHLHPEGDKFNFMRRLFAMFCQDGRYKLDPVKADGTPVEIVTTPELTHRQGIYDCKKAATFIASVLVNVGIVPVLKLVYFSKPGGGWEDFSHIYIIVPWPDLKSYVTLDPVNDCKFDKEVQHGKAILYFLNGTKMELHQMGNIGNTQNKGGWNFSETITSGLNMLDDDLNNISGNACSTGATHEQVYENIFETATQGIGATGKGLHLKKFFKKLKSKFKNVALGIPRGAYLSLLELNIHHAATRAALALQKNPGGLQKTWESLGGNFEKLKKHLAHGAKRKPILGIGEAPTGITPAALAASAIPVLLKIKKFLDDNNIKLTPQDEQAADKGEEEAVQTAAGDDFKTSQPVPGATIDAQTAKEQTLKVLAERGDHLPEVQVSDKDVVTYKPGADGPAPTMKGSLDSMTIDNREDLLNFIIKAPIYTAPFYAISFAVGFITTAACLLYATRHQLKKLF